MRLIFFTISFLVFGSCFAQKIIKPLEFTKDSISVNVNIKLKEAVSFKKVVIFFDKVLLDSCCPKNVNCVRAGEAKILLSIYENSRLKKNRNTN